MTKVRASLLALSLAALAASATAAAPANAMGKIRCDRTNIAAVALGSYDPIVNHNGTGSAHEHQFFGNIAWHSLPNPNRANYADLVGKDNNCRSVLGLAYSADSAGYWVPTLRYKAGTPHAGLLIPARQFTAYYRGFTGRAFGPGMAFPADTRLVATDDLGTGAHGWNCGEFSRQARREGTVGHIPDCSGEPGGAGHTLTAHITFPSCWDGVRPYHPASAVGDTSDTRHYRYPEANGVCPAGFPYQMTQLRETVQFDYVGKGTDVELSSDAHGGYHDGESMHADFWNTWRQAEFQNFVRLCTTSRTLYYSHAYCQP